MVYLRRSIGPGGCKGVLLSLLLRRHGHILVSGFELIRVAMLLVHHHRRQTNAGQALPMLTDGRESKQQLCQGKHKRGKQKRQRFIHVFSAFPARARSFLPLHWFEQEPRSQQKQQKRQIPTPTAAPARPSSPPDCTAHRAT